MSNSLPDSLSDILDQFDQETKAKIKESNASLDAERDDARELRKALGLQYDDTLALAKISNMIKQHNGTLQVVVTLPGKEKPFNISNLTVLNAVKDQDALRIAEDQAKHFKSELEKLNKSK